jgi:hypothetical protein
MLPRNVVPTFGLCSRELTGCCCWIASGSGVPTRRARSRFGTSRSPRSKGRSAYIPTRFVSAERNVSVDKLLLAFDASVFSQAYGVARPDVGKLIHGREHATTTVPLAPLYPKVNQFSPPSALSTPTLHRRHSC